MSKEKQIEDVKDLTKQFDYKNSGNDLYELYGWRKASEVAMEIFEDIEKVFIEHFDNANFKYGSIIAAVFIDVVKLKKNYLIAERYRQEQKPKGSG